MRRRGASKAPLAVAAILATPLFFAALMAISLAVEKPAVHHAVRQGKEVVTRGDPAGATEAATWLLALVPAAAVLLAGVAALFLGRAGVAVASLAAIAAAIVLFVPLPGWERAHTERYPNGVDLVPLSAGSEDIYRRGEWEASARTAAEQLALTTIGIAGAAIAISVALAGRRRRRAVLPPPPPPPPETVTAQPQV